jgi:hypothetical protein
MLITKACVYLYKLRSYNKCVLLRSKLPNLLISRLLILLDSADNILHLPCKINVNVLKTFFGGGGYC